MIIPSDPFWIQIYLSIIKTNQRIGAELVTLHPATMMHEMDKFKPEAIIDQVLAQGLDVLITTEIPAAILEGILSKGLPVLCLAEVLDISHPDLTMFSEMDEGGYLAGKYICQELGGKGRVMIVTAAKMTIQSVGQSRLRGFLAAMEEAPGIQVEHIPGYWTYQNTYEELLHVLREPHEPYNAVFGASDTILFAVRDACVELGQLDASTILVGLNGDPQCLVGVAEGSIHATVDVGTADMGVKILEYAHQAAFGQPVPRRIPFAFQVVTKANVASVAAHKLTSVADLPNYLVGYDRQKEHDRLIQLEAVAEISHQISSMLNRVDLSAGISSAVRKGFGYDWIRILRYNESSQQLIHYGGDCSPASAQIPIEQDELLQTAKTNFEQIIIPDTLTSFRWKIGEEWCSIRSRAILPVLWGDTLVGILDLQSPKPILQPSFETTGFRMLADQVSIAMHNADLYSEALQARLKAEALAAENSRLYAELVKSSLLDDLTGALNRRGLMERGRNELSHARRLNYEIGILMFDLDNFKMVNDTFGHGVGDQVLRTVVQVGQFNIREIDVFGRYGGDEFVIIMPGCNLEALRQTAERLRACIEELVIPYEGYELRTTISVGMAIYKNKEMTLEELLQKVDQALYAAKQAGRNVIHF